NVYTVTFQGALAHTNVDPLTANAKLLVNATALGTISVAVGSDPTNTSPADLARDVQKAIDQELYNQNLSIGFNPTVAYFSASTVPGAFSTGVIPSGGPAYLADKAPFTALSGNLPSDLTLSVFLPATSKKFLGRLRAADVAANTMPTALQAAVNLLLNGTGVSVSVTDGGSGRLSITPTGGSLELRIDSPIKTTAGGRRI